MFGRETINGARLVLSKLAPLIYWKPVGNYEREADIEPLTHKGSVRQGAVAQS